MTDRDNITLPREAVEKIHEAWGSEVYPPATSTEWYDIMDALRAALAAEQPKPEPVAWQERHLFPGMGEWTNWYDHQRPRLAHHPLEEVHDRVRYQFRPLYAAPPDSEAMRRDAERYWWLKAKVEDYDGHACFPEVPYPAPIPDRSPFDAVDAAIDAAMEDKR